MGHDPFSPISLAQVNVLCVPAGEVTADKFEDYLRAFHAFNIVATKNLASKSDIFQYGKGHILLKVDGASYGSSSTGDIGSDFNAKAQIVLGFIDGERLAADDETDRDQQLAATLNSFGQADSAFHDAAVKVLVVLGGSQISVSNDIYFVDLEGDGPSILDVLKGIVSRFQDSLEPQIRETQQKLQITSASSTDNNSSSVTQPSRTPELARNPPSRSDSPAIGGDLSGSSSNERSSAIAQYNVILGQLNLLAGQWPEAIRHFAEGAAVARNSMNPFWHGKGLEGVLVCMLLCAWSHIDTSIPQVCYPVNDRKTPVLNSPSMTAVCASNRTATDLLANGKSFSLSQSLTVLVPHLLNTITASYERAAGIFQDDAHFRLLCQIRVRFGRLLLIMRRRGGILDDASLQYFVEEQSSNVLARAPDGTSAASLVLPVKALTKIFVDAAFEAQSRISVAHAAPIQIAVASSLSTLGVERKQAFYLREFLQRLGPALIEARRIGAAEIGVHPSASLSPLDDVHNGSGRSSRLGMKALLQMVCESYGLPASTMDRSEQAMSLRECLGESLSRWSTTRQNGDIAIKLDILNLCIEVADAVRDFQCSLDFTSRLLQASIAKLTLHPSTSNIAPAIPISEQSRLISSIQNSVNTAARYGMGNIRTSYWDKCLVRDIQLAEESYSNRLMRRTAQDLSLASAVRSEVRKDPFIFNPFARTRTGAGQSVVVVGEQARFSVALQNPLQVDVEIEDIMLTSEGCDFQADHHSIVLGPLCSQTFTLTGRPMQEGDVVITGCNATIRGCHPESFLIIHGDWTPMRMAKHMVTSVSPATLGDSMLPEVKQLSLKVIKALPKLNIASTSLTQQSLMLLEGERTRFSLTLQNDSDLNIDFVLLTFEDSVTKRLEEALSNKDLLPADLYEIQNQIAHRPVIKTINTGEDHDKSKIPARGRAEFMLEVFGRPGLTDVTLLIDYTYLGVSKENISMPFYTRQLRHTVTTTVNGSIDIPRCLVLSLQGKLLSSYTAINDSEEENARVETLQAEGAENNHCMLLLDVRNIWPQPLDVEFRAKRASVSVADRGQDFDTGSSVTDTLQPGQMTRLLLMIPRILVTDPYAPIPSLDTKRQFVVSASRMTIEAEAASRESFWYRERLLDCLQATWKEPNGHRQGHIDMRKGIRLSSRMIDALRIDLVEMKFSLAETQAPNGTSDAGTVLVTRVGESHYRVARNTMFTLFAHVHNRSNAKLRLLMRLQPSLRYQPHNIALDLSKRFTWTGTLQRALPSLEPNEVRQVELGMIALAEGGYDVNGTVEEIRSRQPKTESSVLEVGSGVERRMWHARDPCLIDVVEDSTR